MMNFNKSALQQTLSPNVQLGVETGMGYIGVYILGYKGNCKINACIERVFV